MEASEFPEDHRNYSDSPAVSRTGASRHLRPLLPDSTYRRARGSANC